MRPISSPCFAAVLMTTLLGVFCATGVAESEAEGEANVEVELLIHRRDSLVDKTLRQVQQVRLPLKPQFFSESPTSLSVPLSFYSERTSLNGLGAPLLT